MKNFSERRFRRCLLCDASAFDSAISSVRRLSIEKMSGMKRSKMAGKDINVAEWHHYTAALTFCLNKLRYDVRECDYTIEIEIIIFPFSVVQSFFTLRRAALLRLVIVSYEPEPKEEERNDENKCRQWI